MNEHSRFWHQQYEDADVTIRTAVDSAVAAAQLVLLKKGFETAQDDRAEILVASIMEYLTNSAKEN